MPIAWSETAPSDGSNANLGASEIRSLKTTLATALSQSLYWPGSGGGSVASAGQLKPGTARAFYGTESQVSANTDGQLMVTSDTSRLFAVNANTTLFLGSMAVVEQVAAPPANHRWVLAQSRATGSANGISLSYGVTYGATPTISISVMTSASTAGTASVSLPDSSGFTVDVYRMGGNTKYASSTWSVYWTSVGTVSF